jgi:hypothetical protein
MGCAIYISLFQNLSTFLQWVVQIKSVIDTVVHFLDYFIFAGEAITNDFEIPMNIFLKISEELVFQLGKIKQYI